MSSISRASSAFAFCLLLFGCGAAAPLDSPEPLPVLPQAFPNPTSGFVVFRLIEAGASRHFNVFITNGGQNTLEITEIALEGVDADAFMLEQPESNAIASGEALTLALTFNPSQRGVHQARLRVQSNAENHPDIAFRLIGPASAAPMPTGPDIQPFDSDVEIDGTGFVRFFNLGGGPLRVYEYGITGPQSTAFALPSGQTVPVGDCPEAQHCPDLDATECTPVQVGSGDFVVLTVQHTGSAGDEATMHIVSNDGDSCAMPVVLSGGS